MGGGTQKLSSGEKILEKMPLEILYRNPQKLKILFICFRFFLVFSEQVVDVVSDMSHATNLNV